MSDTWRLVDFDPSWAAIVAGWAATADDALAWCSSAVFPVPASTVAGWGNDADVEPHALRFGDDLVAYGEVWIDDDEAETELARIIVAPQHRGSGVGRELTRRLAERAAQRYPDVVLRVRPGNDRAVRCYDRAGFARMSSDDEHGFNVGQPVDYVWMRWSGAPAPSTEGTER